MSTIVSVASKDPILELNRAYVLANTDDDVFRLFTSKSVRVTEEIVEILRKLKMAFRRR